MRTIHLETISSTNDYAKEHVNEFSKKEIVCICAEYQEAGRGQFGRRWISPKGVNLLVTFCLFQEGEPLLITRKVATMLKEVLNELGLEASIKWPNDLKVNGKKIAGILTETKEGWLIIGIAINVNMTETMLNGIDQRATSLLLETKKSHDIKTLLELVKKQINLI